MNLAIPDLDDFDPAVSEILGRMESIDSAQLFFLHNELQDYFVEKAKPGQLKALALRLKKALERHDLTQSVLDHRPERKEAMIRKAKGLLLDESLGMTYADQSLIGGYLLTLNKASKEFTSRNVNDYLESLGVTRIANITAALSALESQGFLSTVDKGGESPQGQKRHLFTAEGYERAGLLLSLRDAA